jgi:cell wall-associated NlpC family hydrolase
MSISKGQYAFFCEQDIPYEGEVEGLGYAYRGFSTSAYPINKSGTDTVYLVNRVNICVASGQTDLSAAMETKIMADLKRIQADMVLKINEMSEKLRQQSIANMENSMEKLKVSEAARAAREAETIAKADAAAKTKAAAEKAASEKAAAKKAETDRVLAREAEILKELYKDFYKSFVPVSTYIDRSHIEIQVKELERMLSGLQNQVSSGSDPIQKALKSVEEYIGKTKYKQEGGSLRTDTTEEALEYMDCTEFAARFLQIVCGLEKIPSFSTEMLKSYAEKGKKYGGFIEYVEGSDDEEFTDIQPGDVFLWRTDGKGHVGVVKSYDGTHVHIIEALTRGYETSLNGGANEPKNQVRLSKYTRTGKALQGHAGWKGYFRPIINK